MQKDPGFNPLLSEAWFATNHLDEGTRLFHPLRFNPLLSEAWFATANSKRLKSALLINVF